MNLQKIKDHFPEYSDMNIGEFFKHMHEEYYPDMKITDMYKALLKLTEIIKKEEVQEVEKVEDVEADKDKHKEAPAKDKIDILMEKIDTMMEGMKEEPEEDKIERQIKEMLKRIKKLEDLKEGEQTT